MHWDGEGELGYWCGPLSAGYPSCAPSSWLVAPSCWLVCEMRLQQALLPPGGVLGTRTRSWPPAKPRGAWSGTPGPWGPTGVPAWVQPITVQRNHCWVQRWLRVLSSRQDQPHLQQPARPSASPACPHWVDSGSEAADCAGGRFGPPGAAMIPPTAGAEHGCPQPTQIPGAAPPPSPPACKLPGAAAFPKLQQLARPPLWSRPPSSHPPTSPSSLLGPPSARRARVLEFPGEPWGAQLSGQGCEGACTALGPQDQPPSSPGGVSHLHSGCSWEPSVRQSPAAWVLPRNGGCCGDRGWSCMG